MDESDDDSDVEIITERKDGSKPAPPPRSQDTETRNYPQRSASADVMLKPAPVKKADDLRESSALVVAPSTDQTSQAASKSIIGINATPIRAASEEPITHANIDKVTSHGENMGTDYFSYGFDEFAWALCAAKQVPGRSESGTNGFVNKNKKMRDEFEQQENNGGNEHAASMPKKILTNAKWESLRD